MKHQGGAHVTDAYRANRRQLASRRMFRALRIFVQNADTKDKDYVAFRSILGKIEGRGEGRKNVLHKDRS